MDEGNFRVKKIIKRSFILFGIIVFVVIIFLLANQKPKEKKWTYESLEQEFGGIIETDFQSAKNCLEIIENHDYVVCGFIVEKSNHAMLGVDLYYIKIADGVSDAYNENAISVSITKNAYDKVSEGDFVYATGTLGYTDYGTSKIENTVSMSCNTSGYISLVEIDGYSSVNDYTNIVRKISEDTWFQTEGLIMQDGEYSDETPIYKLYGSKESYKENKYEYIRIELSEEQHNLNGKTATIIGRPDTYLHSGLVDCSIIEE